MTSQMLPRFYDPRMMNPMARFAMMQGPQSPMMGMQPPPMIQAPSPGGSPIARSPMMPSLLGNEGRAPIPVRGTAMRPAQLPIGRGVLPTGATNSLRGYANL